MAIQIQIRRDTAAGWADSNPVLAQGELGLDTDLMKIKIGDGTSTWSELDFSASGDVADFVFAYDSEEGESLMTVTDHDMVIRTVRDNDSVGSDCDVNIEAADDVFIRAYGDEVGIYASSNVVIRTDAYDGLGTGGTSNTEEYEWKFNDRGQIEFPDGTIQTTSAQGIIPLPDFLNWREGTTHLPELNTNFGWNSDGLWFQNAQDEGSTNSYPIFTDFTIAQNEPVIVEFDFLANTECNDVGVCVYVDETTPQWDWSPNTTRIAAQFDCFNLELVGRTTEVTVGEGEGIPETGIYTFTFTYNPTAETDKVTVSYKAQGSSEVIASLSLNEALPAGPYRIGFAADQSSSNTKTYMFNLSIDVNNDTDFYSNSLENGNSGFTSDTDLVLPVAIKDDSGDDFITFTRTSTGTARIESPQDDLSLRSARDITLFAGEEGPGNVYIGWGDATITPDATNRVATIADIIDNHGDFNFNDNVMFTEDVTARIEAKRDSSTQGAAIELDPYDGQVTLLGYSSNRTNSYSTSDWADAMWSAWGEGGSQVLLTDATSLVTFLNDTFNSAPFRSVSINGSEYYPYDGMSGNSSEVTIYLLAGAPDFPTTVTSLEFRYQTVSRIEIDDDDEEILLEGKGLNVKLRSTGNISFKSSLDADSEYNWEMDSNGKFQLPGDGYIENVVNGSGDGNGGDTLKIVPDSTLESNDQYLIIDPTEPSHIHIRAGGEQDNSNAEIILGAEQTNVRVSDGDREVSVSTKKSLIVNSYTNINPDTSADFITGNSSEIYVDGYVNVDGTDYLITEKLLDTPSEGFTTVRADGAIFAGEQSYTFTYQDPNPYTWVFSESDGLVLPPEASSITTTTVPGNITLGAYDGVRLNFADTEGSGLAFPDDTLQTTAFVGGATGSFVSQDGKQITVTNGIITDITAL